MKIAIASDHAGYESPGPFYKPEIARHVAERGHEVVDCGTNGPESVDYPDFGERACQEIIQGNAERGILICGTGMGICMAANRHPGIRAAVATSREMAELARSHNNANVLCLGRRVLSLEQCIEIIDTWLDTPFSEGERHQRRIQKLG